MLDFRYHKQHKPSDNLKKYVNKKVNLFKTTGNDHYLSSDSLLDLWLKLSTEEKLIADCVDKDINWLKNKGDLQKEEEETRKKIEDEERHFFDTLDVIDPFSIIGRLVLLRLRPKIFNDHKTAIYLSTLYLYLELYDLAKILLDFAMEIRNKEYKEKERKRKKMKTEQKIKLGIEEIEKIDPYNSPLNFVDLILIWVFSTLFAAFILYFAADSK